MAKKHIISIGYTYYAFDSVKAATDCLALLSKATLCERTYDGRTTFKPHEDPGSREDLHLALNQNFIMPIPPKPEKPLALPRPKKGTILCICEKSSVAPGQTCTHCGRSFHESHNRTHDNSPASNLHLL